MTGVQTCALPIWPNNKIINKQTKTHNEIIGKYKEIIKDKKDFIKENDIKKFNEQYLKQRNPQNEESIHEEIDEDSKENNRDNDKLHEDSTVTVDNYTFEQGETYTGTKILEIQWWIDKSLKIEKSE